MPALDALTVRTRVTEQLQGHTFKTIIDGFVADVEAKDTAIDQRYHAGVAEKFGSAVFTNAMAIAETYYLSPEMHDICQEASSAADFPMDETIMREDPPSEAGFLYLPARFRMMELRGRLMVAHAFVWLNNRVWLLCDRTDPDDEMNAELNQVRHGQVGLPRYDLMNIVGFQWGKPMPKMMSFEKGVLPTDARVDFRHDKNGQTMMFTDALIHPGMSTPIEQVSPELRFLLTVWRMMQQTLAEVVREEPANKPARRYADRAGLRDQSVHVIQLRRRESHTTGDGSPLTVRFMVRGHWRRVWCGPAHARYRRAVWIHPHIRGPEDAPLIHREKIHALVR